MNQEPHCRCPICGHYFDVQEGMEIFICPTDHPGENGFTREELVGDDDDYAWCY